MYKVLLVDDEILVREGIRENIDWNSLGYELIGDCQNGKEAVAFMNQLEVDVVLTDICMPFMDGIELSEYLYNNFPDTAIIIFSGFEEFEYAKKAIQYKVSEYILKPVTKKELSGVLTQVRLKLEKNKSQQQTLGKLTKAYEVYKKNTPVITSKVLSHLVMGTQETSKCLNELRELGIAINATDYRIVVVEIDIYSELFDADEIEKKESALMSFVVQNISNEIVREYGLGLAYLAPDNRVFLLIQTNKPRESSLAARNMCKMIKEQLMNTMKLQVSVGMGVYVQRIEDLYLSYESAVKTLNYRYILGGGILLDMEELHGKLDGTVHIEVDLKTLAAAIRRLDIKAVELVLETIRIELVENMVSRNRATLYLQQVLRKINDIIIEMNGEIQLHTNKRNELLTQIANSRTYEEAHEAIHKYAVWSVEYLSNIHHTSGQRQSILALDYIKDNYCSPDLSLNDICTYLNISTSHFSATFKEVTGETFMEVLIRMRMQKAKELLEQTTLKNYEIAERVGFSDPHYFSIAFKKMIGKTPTEYAKENR